jgi:Mg2+-importing ATPase
MTDDVPTATPFWLSSLAECEAQARSSPAGLTAAEAAARLAKFGTNTLAAKRRRPAWLDYLAHLRSPLVLLLLAACAVSALVHDRSSALVIAAIVLGSVTLDFLQERRAGDAAERLRESVALRARVRRDAAFAELPVSQIVPGDLVQLAAGDLVPADGRVVEARDFFVRQASLTGEAYPVEKYAGELGPQAHDLASATNAVFMGSSVLSGSASVIVVHTGRDTFLGGIAGTLREESAPSAFERGTRRFGYLIMRITFLLVVFVTMAQLLGHRPVVDTFLFAVALAVGLTPELLPMVVSVTLARGAVRLAARRVVVKRLSAIQDLGSMDILCTDKTGTLTEARIALQGCVDASGADMPRVRELAYVNSVFETGLRSPLDEAILATPAIDLTGWTKLDEVPFGFERRRVSVLVERGGQRLLVVKGAPEDLLPLCSGCESAAGPAGASASALDAEGRARILARFEDFSRQGLRVLAVASRQVRDGQAHADVSDERDLVFCGFASFLDPPKAGAAEAIARLRHLHVHVKVVTGDNEGVARHVCAQVGLPVHRLLTGSQLDALDDPTLAAQAGKVDVFCRVSPAQKSRVLRLLRRRGHVVGFLGDGVNDAPSLHDADVGISVDSAVDVAKEAADMILLDRDLGVVGDGVVEGRRTFANVMKYIMMATSSNFGNMLSMAAASLVLPFLPMLPVQILLNNLLYDSSEIAIPFDDVDARDVERPHDWDPAFIRRFMLTFGPVSSAFDFATFGVLHWGFHAGEALFRTGWFVESMVSQVLVIFVLRTRGRAWRSRPHRALVAAALAIVAIAVALPWTPLGRAVGFVAPGAGLLLAIAVLALAYLGCVELAKKAFYGRHHGHAGRRKAALVSG